LPEDTLLVCMPVKEMEGEPVAGSVAMLCDECGAAIWVAPSSRALLDRGDPFLLACTQCALKEALRSTAVTGAERKSRAIERLRKQAEEAYDRMYDARDDRAARWEYEMAYDSLRSAAGLARELGRIEDAVALDRRAEHIRKVFRHQFMYPPDRVN